MGKLTISMAIFHSYVSLPEVIPCSKAKFYGESLVGGLEHGLYCSIYWE